ncbi:DNA (cytosine-5-)-methyltransferase [Mucilaginibacter terrenus]|uniref:DNA (cytosine-5-)-methyltransferase n=1 Tax=Mucilaginibacter terrenus TaxID=2482727 RepID=A0A3E2NKG6_9SPHI|nr:DNA (cytosine-5-)-methyltransferase [Mucilaginibacter terrenus]RFZ81433.1 DNA (cytosine-5-)-methyltransferase [Mucilaginibacter terrenus]
MVKKIIDKNVIEFFAGIGLMRSGLEKADWQVTYANDIDPVKKKLYTNNFLNSESHFVLEDIHNLSEESMPSASLATASFPCTDLSVAGKREGLNGQHSSAFWGFIRILTEMGERRPNLVLLENVVGFLTSHNGDDLKDALLALNCIGYAVDVFIINAVHFVPQSRVRLFIVGKYTGVCREPQLRHLFPPTDIRPKKLVNFVFNHPEINWDINHELPPLPSLSLSLKQIVQEVEDQSKAWWSTERVNYFLNQTFERHFIKLIQLRDKQEVSYLTAFRRKRNGKSMAEIRFDGIAGCLRTPKGGSARQILIHVGRGEIKIRLLNPLECARLMGADDFTITGTDQEALFGFGDAVCVPVITWIGEKYLTPTLIKLTKQFRLTSENIDEYAKPA